MYKGKFSKRKIKKYLHSYDLDIELEFQEPP